MEYALKEGGLAPEELFYINAHGTGTHHNDLFETRAIKRLFGEHAHAMKINSTKSMIGHLLGAAGAVEAIACVKELQENYIHETAGYRYRTRTVIWTMWQDMEKIWSFPMH